jgi:hypothetical protein
MKLYYLGNEGVSSLALPDQPRNQSPGEGLAVSLSLNSSDLIMRGFAWLVRTIEGGGAKVVRAVSCRGVNSEDLGGLARTCARSSRRQ